MNEDLLNVMGSFSETALDCIEKQNEEIKQLEQENQQLKAELELYKGSLKKEHEQVHRANDLEDRINKAIKITYKIIMNNADNRMICNKEEEEYFDWLDREMLEQEKILKGE